MNDVMFYEQKFNFSYSSLSKLLYNPELFYKEYILGEREKLDTVYFTEGKLIHCLLLEPEKFDTLFSVMTGDLPSANTKIVIDRVFAHHLELKASNLEKGNSLIDYSNAILDVLLDMNLHQGLTDDKKTEVTGNQKRIDKICTVDSINYWNYLSNSNGKQVIDAQVFDKCKEIVSKIKLNTEISNLLKLNHSSEWWTTIEVFNELPLSMTLKKYPFGLHGVIDNIVIDPLDKIIRINDFKTTSKILADFPETVKFYKYNLQAAIYNLLVINNYADLIKDGYKIEFRFIVVDKLHHIYPFLVSRETMDNWTKELQSTLKIAEYHYTNKDYTLPYIFKQEGIIL
jgi:hypothetical protein